MKTLLSITPVTWNFYRYRDQELPSALADRGYRCIYLNPVRYLGFEHGSQRLHDTADNPVPENLTVIQRSVPFRKSLRAWLFEANDNLRQIKKYQPDAVIASDHLMSARACRYCFRNNIPFIFDITDDWAAVDTHPLTRLYWKIIARPTLRRYATAITSTSRRQAEDFTSRKRTAHVIPNGKTQAYLQQAARFPSGESREVNFIASLRNWYDFDLLFELFAGLPQLTLNIYGDGPLRTTLEEKARAFANIRIHAPLPPDKLAEYTVRSRFGLLPLKMNKLNRSTCPIKLFDYWGARLPVIASPTEELQRLGGDCILFAATTAEYRHQIERLLTEDGLAAQLGEQGFQKMEHIHNYDKITDQFESILTAAWRNEV